MPNNTAANDAELRDQILGSCRLIERHAKGLVIDAHSIVTMPAYKTEAEDALNKAERMVAVAASAIAAAKIEMGTKQWEGV